LAIFMIVAVSDFNMGAMENKGLNIFNAKYILANPDTATDQDYEGITVVVSHEYFHNWTGNRITCRDWFQLSLKEGLTVYRDQEFTADVTSRPVARIDDVRLLKANQFPEDNGPLAHAIRPSSYIEMNNFYTSTVYNKGAEVIRMLKTLEGVDGFRAGMDLYFDRFDGMAVTCDDFVGAHSDANQSDYQQFMRWYSQAGTPVLKVCDKYDAILATYEISFEQQTDPSADGSAKEPFFIPICIGLLDPEGKVFALDQEGCEEKVLILKEAKQTFVFRHINEQPVPSLLRNFSAPVKYHYPYTLNQLLCLLRYDVDSYNRYAAATQLIYQLATNHQLSDLEAWLSVLETVLFDCSIDDALKARILTVPSEKEFADQQSLIDVPHVIAQQHLFCNTIAQGMQDHFLAHYEKLKKLVVAYAFVAEQVGVRALSALCLRNIHLAEPILGESLCRQQYFNADNMTDRFNALAIMVHQGSEPTFEPLLADFYQRYQHDALVIEKWLSLQATIPHKDALLRVKSLLTHSAFDMKNPNKVRALIGAFANQNFVGFHCSSGAGYEFLAEQIIVLNAINPQIAARLVQALSQWRRFSDNLAVLQRSALQRILLTDALCNDVYEMVSKMLA
jgi:aminopeptidase N